MSKQSDADEVDTRPYLVFDDFLLEVEQPRRFLGLAAQVQIESKNLAKN
jgi:hypothetical protein